MVDAGIACPDSTIEKFKELQKGRAYHAVIFKIANKKEVIVDAVVENDDTDEGEWDWDVICEKIVESGEPRFAACDFHWRGKKEDRDMTKVLFISWTPESARPGDKMLYASTKEGFKAKLDGVQKVIQATDDSELGHEAIVEHIDAL